MKEIRYLSQQNVVMDTYYVSVKSTNRIQQFIFFSGRQISSSEMNQNQIFQVQGKFEKFIHLILLLIIVQFKHYGV